MDTIDEAAKAYIEARKAWQAVLQRTMAHPEASALWDRIHELAKRQRAEDVQDEAVGVERG